LYNTVLSAKKKRPYDLFLEQMIRVLKAERLPDRKESPEWSEV
jgi:hypothetical protein